MYIYRHISIYAYLSVYLGLAQELRDSAQPLASSHVDRHGVKRCTGNKRSLKQSQTPYADLSNGLFHTYMNVYCKSLGFLVVFWFKRYVPIYVKKDYTHMCIFIRICNSCFFMLRISMLVYARICVVHGQTVSPRNYPAAFGRKIASIFPRMHLHRAPLRNPSVPGPVLAMYKMLCLSKLPFLTVCMYIYCTHI